ncbi:hypothetical protein BATDEDRAFT_88304 [Batrachochytrium dendrobatidis JAM81]|uniref:Uncharacterized protein n=1 Tax=Batrachochytrium dendrobatidis (strain JAM81 / FGSC 10211) TaxID=684364 RepID=F4P2E2_BATDJ|nr:uncharacterized protein BATDEDRAFT_88304 [Batrachochytrium dendrobatidis JAM81]XP_006680450.1 uncharacterized protein BATDEDRAFT_90244 [Batrachochytrium dendrobatidis JAM81]XP_006682252.1 uncharacterized protein BATDEDRAFT_91878 [Batrachochytrium dendrobatidis JAM81]EGF77043.1 hypothetical protein BATDEDRAFT_91878 [Batrachochytrium dendrobatidis JAM81]EGF78783.1 hypothetical protein BATDEDRAFT_90244 [Batrachochytrium dendrobatidis JAM81]EGF80574.1 hypothetical protein BATDEDRAFT_88304 [Batr|eukprot:XP_006678622.1 hypothetical protein BATDEDRAFT_88304 [Batrachochytrium dendrobatidis JAM81]
MTMMTFNGPVYDGPKMVPRQSQDCHKMVPKTLPKTPPTTIVSSTTILKVVSLDNSQIPHVRTSSRLVDIDYIATPGANPFPKVTDLFCRLPLSTLFYQLEAVHLGDLLRL